MSSGVCDCIGMDETKALIRKLRQIPGVEVVKAKRNSHLKIYRDGKLISSMPASPSCTRGKLNQLAHLRKQGIRI